MRKPKVTAWFKKPGRRITLPMRLPPPHEGPEPRPPSALRPGSQNERGRDAGRGLCPLDLAGLAEVVTGRRKLAALIKRAPDHLVRLRQPLVEDERKHPAGA